MDVFEYEVFSIFVLSIFFQRFEREFILLEFTISDDVINHDSISHSFESSRVLRVSHHTDDEFRSVAFAFVLTSSIERTFAVREVAINFRRDEAFVAAYVPRVRARLFVISTEADFASTRDVPATRSSAFEVLVDREFDSATFSAERTNSSPRASFVVFSTRAERIVVSSVRLEASNSVSQLFDAYEQRRVDCIWIEFSSSIIQIPRESVRSKSERDRVIGQSSDINRRRDNRFSADYQAIDTNSRSAIFSTHAHVVDTISRNSKVTSYAFPTCAVREEIAIEAFSHSIAIRSSSHTHREFSIVVRAPFYSIYRDRIVNTSFQVNSAEHPSTVR